MKANENINDLTYHLFIHPLNSYLLSAYQIPDSVISILDHRDCSEQTSSCPHGASILVKTQTHKYTHIYNQLSGINTKRKKEKGIE